MRMSPTPTRGFALAIFLAMLGLGVHPVRAQGTLSSIPQAGNPETIGGPPPQLTPDKGPQQAKPPPAALPGAASRADRVAPSQGPASGNPTDALFDSINRGDIAAARDAVDRGADLRAQNVLGMTPLDLSVDLGRNDITFFLLSLRGASSRSAGGAPSQKAAAKPGAAKVAQKPPVKPPVKAATAVRAPSPAPTSQQFAGGGTPDPAAGFLGFGTPR